MKLVNKSFTVVHCLAIATGVLTAKMGLATENQVSDRAPASTTIPASAPSGAPSPVKITGFVDPQFQMTSQTNTTSKGFVINDGALYLAGTMGSNEVHLDIPFRMFTIGSPDFEIFNIRGQAYVSGKSASGLGYKLGQFDSTYGFETNDTADIVFTRQGIVYTFTDPFVHTGLQLQYELSSAFSFYAYIANPHDFGVLPQSVNMTGTSGSNGLQYGLQAVYVGASTRFAAGGLTHYEQAASGMNTYGDLTAGITLGDLALDAEVSYNKSQSWTDSALGLLAQAVYTLNDKWTVGFRGDNVSGGGSGVTTPEVRAAKTSLPAAAASTRGFTPVYSQTLLFVGPQYNIASNIKLKADYSYQSIVDAKGGNAVLEHGMNFGIVYKF